MRLKCHKSVARGLGWRASWGEGQRSLPSPARMHVTCEISNIGSSNDHKVDQRSLRLGACRPPRVNLPIHLGLQHPKLLEDLHISEVTSLISVSYAAPCEFGAQSVQRWNHGMRKSLPVKRMQKKCM